MFGNEDNSTKINVDKGCNGMSEGTVTISFSECKEILELAYKAAILLDVLFENAELGYHGKLLLFMANTPMDTIVKCLFPNRYAEKLAELTKGEDE